MLEGDVAISFLVAEMFGRMMARLGIARAFVRDPGVSQSSFVQRWYVALSARLRLAGLISPWAGELLAWAREDQPHSPEILFERGRVAELTAAGAGALQIKQRSLIIPALADRERERFYSRNLKEGVEWLRESAARRPSAPGPRLHLARLLIASGSGSDATILLDPLAAQDGDVDSAYVARLFLGGLAEEAVISRRRCVCTTMRCDSGRARSPRSLPRE